MARTRRVLPQPLHDVAEDGRGGWIVTGGDPQFRLDGPFTRGFWEVRFRGAAPAAPAFDAVRIYYGRNGEFSEAGSVRFRGLGERDLEHRLTFWLPFPAQWLRLDPTEFPGALRLGPVDLRHRPAPLVLLGGVLRRARHAPRTLVHDLFRAASAPKQERNRVLHRMVGPDDIHLYEKWLTRHVAHRAVRYPAGSEPGLFSLLTTVYDTPEGFVDALRTSVMRQTWRDFEWIVLDNGSSQPGTARALKRLARDPRVRLLRVEHNLGIVGGMRTALEHATRRYVLPVDSDDHLFPDALHCFASVLQRRGYPTLLYSDEDKLQGASHTDPFFKPDWDPVLLRNCCYIAHLCAIDRREALRLGLYTDPAAEGCHDWDTFLRFVRAGQAAVHVPEIVYSWRMHHSSTAANTTAKSYVVESQRHVLQKHVAATGAADRLEVVPSPFFPSSPDWWIRRRLVDPPAMALVVNMSAHGASPDAVIRRIAGYPFAWIWLTGAADRLDRTVMQKTREAIPDIPVDTAAPLRVALDAAARSGVRLVTLVDTTAMPESHQALWEMAGLKEAFPDAVMIGGRVLDSTRRIRSAAGILGLGSGAASPDRGRHASDVGYFGMALKQRSTSAVSALFSALDPEFLRDCVLPSNPLETAEALMLAVALQARDGGRRVIYSPFIEAQISGSTEFELSHNTVGLPVDDRYYHALLSRDPSHPFEPA
jgi:hypothetical protein